MCLADIIQGYNLNNKNKMWLHTPPGCITSYGDCSSTPGCNVTDAQADSFGSLFIANSGGVFAAEDAYVYQDLVLPEIELDFGKCAF